MSIAEKLTTIAENQQKVYDAGYAAGQAEGGGGDLDAFWDKVQNYGNRTDYSYGFCGKSWNDDTFKPKYDITATAWDQSNVFAMCGIKNLTAICEAQGIKIDLTGAMRCTGMFSTTTLTHIPFLDFSVMAPGTQTTTSVFQNSFNIKRIEGIKVSREGVLKYDGWFTNTMNLEHVLFYGEIATSINIAATPKLDTESVQSIIDCLADLTGQSTQTLTLHKNIVLTDEQKATISSKNWTLVQ